MFNPPSSSSGSNNGDEERIQKLKRARDRDQFEEYQEEKELGIQKKQQRTAEDDEEDAILEQANNEPEKLGFGARMLQKMGLNLGEGLGKNNQGIVEPIQLSTQRGRTGFGNTAGKAVALDLNEQWDDSTENKTIEERVEWFQSCDDEIRHNVVQKLKNDEWIHIDEKKLKIEDETKFCDEQTLKDMLESKNVFDIMSDRDLREARARANPYETIGSAFFQNRAAMKTANIDKIYDWFLSGETLENDNLVRKNPLDFVNQKPKNVDRDKEIFYFADVCAGPGGFSEYMLWRKGFYNAKGFGFTLAGKDDFKMNKFSASSAFYFEPYYGVKNNGDVMDPENIEALEKYVLNGTDNRGVHLMMADGGFSVEGQENLQEILSKRLYLCQLLVSLCIVREGGNFFCKLFDIFTPFSVALVYLMRICYDEISLHKPHTSRPANSERYIICKGLRKEYSDVVRDYLKRVNLKMEMLKNRGDSKDVQEIVPIEMMLNDQTFFQDVVNHNNKIARHQTLYLRKYQSFAKNQGQFDKDQGTLREECLKYWMVPNKPKQNQNRDHQRQSLNAHEVLAQYTNTMYGSRDFETTPFQFNAQFLESAFNSNLSHMEYRFVRTTISREPVLLVAAAETVFLHESGHFSMVDKAIARIPERTVLLVEKAQELRKTSDVKFDKIGGPGIFRILDAAVLNGDDVSALPFDQRMAAAEKFCKALNLVKSEVKIGWGRQQRIEKPYKLTTARVYKLEELDELKDGFDVIKFRGETDCLFTENGQLFQCHGIRFSRYLSNNWHFCWSKSQQKIYANCQKTKESLFEENWPNRGIFSTFWDTSMMTQKSKAAVENMIRTVPKKADVAIPVMTWKWKNLDNSYGPAKIVEETEEFNGLPTIETVKKVVRRVDEECARNVY